MAYSFSPRAHTGLAMCIREAFHAVDVNDNNIFVRSVIEQCARINRRVAVNSIQYYEELCEQQKIQKQQVWGGSTTVKKQVAGTASSVAFTPLQVSCIYTSSGECHFAFHRVFFWSEM